MFRDAGISITHGVSRDCRGMLLSVCSQWAGENPRMSLAGLPAAERQRGDAASVRSGVALSPCKTADRVAWQDLCTRRDGGAAERLGGGAASVHSGVAFSLRETAARAALQDL